MHNISPGTKRAGNGVHKNAYKCLVLNVACFILVTDYV